MNYDFEVTTEPIFYAGLDSPDVRERIKDKKAIINCDTNQVISIVSNRYELLEHKEVVDIFDNVDGLEKGSIKLTLDGGVMFAIYKLAGLNQQEVAVGDMVEFYLRAFNSYNFITGCGFEIIGKRLACLNGMTVPTSVARFSFRHMKNDGLTKLTDSIFKAKMEIPSMLNQWREWNKIYPTQDKKESFVRQLELNEDTETDLEVKMRDKNTLWDVYNVLTKYITHEMQNRGKNKIANQRKKDIEYTSAFYKFDW